MTLNVCKKNVVERLVHGGATGGLCHPAPDLAGVYPRAIYPARNVYVDEMQKAAHG